MMTDRTAAWLRLAMVRGVGPVTGRKLVRAAGGIDALWRQDVRTLSRIEGVGPQLLSALKQGSAAPVEALLEACREQDIGVLSPDDDGWPPSLSGLDDAPLVLFFRGEPTCLSCEQMLAVVGARRASREGVLTTRRWCRFLAEQGVTIVSGMAYGIDAAAHGGALEAGGRTVAVLGSGLLALTEQQTIQVQAIVEAGGCVATEFLPQAPARPEHFPGRNRIIAGLSRAALVMEADVRSGSLITARQALEYGHEIFAVPGSVLGGNHAGCHQLIREGAVLVESGDMVLQELGLQPGQQHAGAERKHYLPASKDEVAILDALAGGSLHLDHLAETCGLTVPELSPILLRLELQGVIERLPGSRYLLSVELHQA